MYSHNVSETYQFGPKQVLCQSLSFQMDTHDTTFAWDSIITSTVDSRYLEVGTIFYKFKLPEVQINLHFG